MRAQISIFLSSLMIFLLLPFLCTFLFHGPQACTLIKRADQEDFIPYLLRQQIEKDQAPEVLKAQAVLVRTNLVYQRSLGKSLDEILTDSFSDIFSSLTWYRIFFLSNSLKKAAAATKEQILTFQDAPCLAPYHQVSSGKTRNGEEVFRDASFSYLQSVDSPWDLDSPDYLTSKDFSSSQLPSSLEIQQTDSAGYVLTLSEEDAVISGEYFRHEMQISSSCFSIQQNGDTTRLICKGQGHGVGLSQYGASAMAQKGSTYDEILTWYFPLLILSSID